MIMSSDWRVSCFEYPAVADDRADGGDSKVWRIEPDPRQRQEAVLREAQAREIGRLEGEARSKAELENAVGKERAAVTTALQDFAAERARYFEQVEGEVVQLALAIARKVLHREAQIDPELLTGLVRYTLEKLSSGTRVRLRVHPGVASEWERTFGSNAQVVADSGLDPGRCLVETEVGTTAVSVEEQLKEIEQGLMDLLAHRPEKR